MSGFSKVGASIDFNSISFPPPPPGAEKWQPDPDSIARPGTLPDRRFRRDLLEPLRQASYKTEGSHSAVASPSPQEGNGMRSLDSWPAPVPRGTGLPRDMIDLGTSAFTSLDGLAKPTSDTSSDVLSLGTKIATATEGLKTVKFGTTYRPLTIKTVSPAKSSGSEWTKKLDNALAQDAESPKLSATAQSISVPAHLRKRVGPVPAKEKLNPTAVSFNSHILSNVENDTLPQLLAEIVVKEKDRLKDEAVAWQLAADEIGDSSGKQAFKLQDDLLSQGNYLKPISPNRRPLYEQKEKAMLIRTMESELDLGKVATMRELMAMSVSDINSYYSKVRSAHKNWWEADQTA